MRERTVIVATLDKGHSFFCLPAVAVGVILLLSSSVLSVHAFALVTPVRTRDLRLLREISCATADGHEHRATRLSSTRLEHVARRVRSTPRRRAGTWQLYRRHESRRLGSLSATNEGRCDEPLLYAQDALDEAWRSKRRVELETANGRSGTLGERLLTALGRGRPSAMFVENRDFMESTLDNVVRVSMVDLKRAPSIELRR